LPPGVWRCVGRREQSAQWPMVPVQMIALPAVRGPEFWVSRLARRPCTITSRIGD